MNRLQTYGDQLLKKYSPEEIVFGLRINHAGQRVTRARLYVLTALSKLKRPASIKTLADATRVHDKSTIYRSLETLVRAGLVKQISIGSSESLYETTVGRPHHHHITCSACGRIEDIEICVNMPSQKKLSAKDFAEITDHTLEFFGLCKKCAENSPKM